MNPFIMSAYQCEKCLSQMPVATVVIARQRIMLLSCPNDQCEESGDTKVVLPASLSAPQVTVITDFIVPGSMASLVLKKRGHNPYSGSKDFELGMSPQTREAYERAR